tara:strand:+ start:1172 stop:1468 length:297 start_codon:yes stop_codon:yes gene_type:complete
MTDQELIEKAKKGGPYVRVATHHMNHGKSGFRTPHRMINGVEHKYCAYCFEWHPVEEFLQSKHHWDKLLSSCQYAMKEKGLIRSEKRSEYQRRYINKK